MLYLLIIIAFIVSVFFSGLIIPRILVVAFRKRLFDVPDRRKIHQGPVPRLGGLSFVPTILFSLTFVVGLRYLLQVPIDTIQVPIVVPEFCFLVCGLTLLYLSGIKDDLVGLRYRTKFFIQFLAAVFFPLSGLWINNLYGLFGVYDLPAWVGIPFTVLVVVYITNAINLIDGIDGLASGLSSVALAVLGSLFLYNGLWLYATLAFSTLGVLLPFFYYNVFGKAERCKKIFMGDTGSLTLGYILAFLAIRYAAYDTKLIVLRENALLISFSTLIVPVLDVIRVMWVRWREHSGLFVADKNHIHHKFLAMGLTPHQAMLSILGISGLFSGLTLLLVLYVPPTLLLLIDIMLWIGMHLWFDRVRNKKQKEKGLTHLSGILGIHEKTMKKL